MSNLDTIELSGYDPGEVIGYRKDGQPILAAGGNARNNYDNWIPEEFGSDVLTRVAQVSAVESYASHVNMNTATKSVPRSAGIGVDYTTIGTAYAEDNSVNDQVVLTARKFTRAIRIAEEDLEDSLANILAVKQKDWATSYGKAIDNATVAVTATAVGAGVPFVSVYAALTQTNANTGYTANANITKAGTAAPSYSGLNNSLKTLEITDYFDESRVMVFAHPSFRATLRGILDNQGRPIFNDYTDQDMGTQGTLFGLPLRWAMGLKTSATATSGPTGNPLLLFANVDYMLLGIRSGPESAFAGADSGVGFLTDEALLKMRARRGFAVGNENAFAIYENNSGL